MRLSSLVGGVLLLVGTIGVAGAAPLSPASLAGSEDASAIVLVQQKSDTVTQRVKRAWKDLTGYKFNVSCPILFPVNHRTCTETGKDRAEARGKCAAQNQFCLIADAQ
jgi:hypothetical protein